jgi:stage II sporulation protein D
VVSAEMPASFPIEALKAQAVAARSYMLYKINSNHRDSVHEGAQLCDDFNHCTAFCEIDTEGKELWKNDYDYYLEKIRSAVSSTDGIVAMSDGKIIAAVFHSASDGATESAENVWGNKYSYLTAVPTSGGDASPNFYGVLEIGKKEFSDKMQSYRGDFNLSENMTDWFKNIIRSESGNVMSITVGGVKLKGTEFRSILGLNSTNFTINIDDDKILINTIGTGHGVGMSQYGARDMALKGAYFDEIICYYYTGVKLMVKN